MRTNNRLKKRVKNVPIKGVYVYYEVKGLNLERFIESLNRKGIHLFHLKKTGDKKLIFAVNAQDVEKLFAINDNVWYNTYKIRRIKFSGKNYPLFFLLKNVGITVGIAFFFALCFVSNDFIFSFSFTGSGSVYQREITEYLSSQGIVRFSRFSQVNLKNLEDNILAANGDLSFVSCVKNGNRLVIDSALLNKSNNRISGAATELVSDENGVIESVKAYRGTAVKKAGDSVNFGETIVAGYADVKETRVPVNVIATATVRYYREYALTLKEDNDGAAAAFAEEFAGKPCFNSEITKIEENGNYIYTVRLYFTKVITVG